MSGLESEPGGKRLVKKLDVSFRGSKRVAIADPIPVRCVKRCVIESTRTHVSSSRQVEVNGSLRVCHLWRQREHAVLGRSAQSDDVRAL